MSIQAPVDLTSSPLVVEPLLSEATVRAAHAAGTIVERDQAPKAGDRDEQNVDAPADADATDERPRFSLRAVLLTMAALSVTFAIVAALPGWLGTVVTWFLILGAAHVFGAAWGKKRVDSSDARGEAPIGGVPRGAGAVTASHFAPCSPLRASASLGRKAILFSCCGACVGFVVGGFLLLWILNLDRMGITGLLLGTLSLSAIGGLLAFLITSFVSVAGNALRSASSTPHAARSPQASARRNLYRRPRHPR